MEYRVESVIGGKFRRAAFLVVVAFVLLLMIAGIPRPAPTPQVALLVTLAACLLAARLLWRRIERRADTRAARLTGDPNALSAALAKLALLQQPPWNWSRMRPDLSPALSRRLRKIAELPSTPQPIALATPPVESIHPIGGRDPVSLREPGLFSPAFRRGMTLSAFAGYALLAPMLQFLVRTVSSSGWPLAMRLLAYAAGTAATVGFLILIRAFANCTGYGLLRTRLFRRLRPQDGAFCVGLSPGGSPRVYDQFTEWDVGFFSLAPGMLTYLGERIAFSLAPREVTSVRLGHGSEGWFSPDWIFIDYQEGERSEVFALILPRLRLFGSLQREVAALHGRLQAWRTSGSFSPSAPKLGPPCFPAIASTPLRYWGPLRHLVQTPLFIGIGAIAAHSHGFPAGSEPFLALCLLLPLAFLLCIFPTIRWKPDLPGFSRSTNPKILVDNPSRLGVHS